MRKLYNAHYTIEAMEDVKKLDNANVKKITKAVRMFEYMGNDAGNSRPLENGLFEIKADQIRAYFKYHDKSIIIIGLVPRKKSKKAPERYKKQAENNIKKYLENNNIIA